MDDLKQFQRIFELLLMKRLVDFSVDDDDSSLVFFYCLIYIMFYKRGEK